MTYNPSTYLRCYQLFHNVNNSKQQDPAVLYCDAYFTTSWQERSANMLPDSLCSSCNNGYTSLDLHTLTLLNSIMHRLITLQRKLRFHSLSSPEHRTLELWHRPRKTENDQSQESQVARCRLRTYNLVEEQETQFLEPSVYSYQSMKRTNDYNKQFLLLLLLFYLWKKFFSHVHVTKGDLKEKSFIFLFSSSTEDEPWKTFWVNGIIS